MMNIWQKKGVELSVIHFYLYIVYTNIGNSFLKQNFVKIFTTHLDHNLKDTGYFIRVSIKSFKKSFLKHVCNVYDFLSSKADSFSNQQWYEMTLDLIESRIYNPPASKTNKTKAEI